MGSLDIDTLLQEEERVSCTFQHDGFEMGNLDPTLVTPTLPKNSKVLLPLWLGKGLMVKNVVDMEIPKHFGKKMREEIRAGPEAIRLREFSFYFFETGLQLANAKNDRELLQVLRMAMAKERFKMLAVRTLFRYALECLCCC